MNLLPTSLKILMAPHSHTYKHFITSICNALELAGLNPKIYASHSFRCGAASAATATGYSNYEIQLIGRWHSNTYKLYIKSDPKQVLHLSSLCHMAHPHLTPYKPPALWGFTALASVGPPPVVVMSRTRRGIMT